MNRTRLANEKVIAEFRETNKQLQKRVDTGVTVTSPSSPTDTSNTLEADDSKVRHPIILQQCSGVTINITPSLV